MSDFTICTLLKIQPNARLKRSTTVCLKKFNVKETNSESIKVLKSANKQLNLKYEQKVHEVKQLKSDLENMNKESNTLSVALKAAKADVKEQNKQTV